MHAAVVGSPGEAIAVVIGVTKQSTVILERAETPWNDDGILGLADSRLCRGPLPDSWKKELDAGCDDIGKRLIEGARLVPVDELG